RSCHVARAPAGSGARRATRGLRSLHRRARRQDPPGDRGRSETAAPPADGQGQRLCPGTPAGRSGRKPVTRRLSLTIFLAVLGSLAVFALAVAFAWWWNAQAREAAFEQRLTRELAVEILPAAAEGPDQLRRALE